VLHGLGQGLIVPTPADHVLFAILAVLFPLWAAAFGMRRLRRASAADLPRARLWLYRRAILIQWTLTLAVAAHWFSRDRPIALLGLWPHVTWGLLGVVLGFGIVSYVIVRQRSEALEDDDALARVRERLQRLEILIPRSPLELSWFFALSVTAGICEELLYRGYLIWYLGHWMGLIPSIVVAAVLFGIGHAYQGPRGVLVTAAVGLFLGLVYAISGSLYAGMVLHALMDVHSGHLGYVALSRRPARAGSPTEGSEPDGVDAGTDSGGAISAPAGSPTEGSEPDGVDAGTDSGGAISAPADSGSSGG
jgi:membrane protease YdiL (CAAX protease family)